MRILPTPLHFLRRPLFMGLTSVVVILSALFNSIAMFFQLRIVFRSEPSYTYLDNDYPRELPLSLRTVNMAFHDDPEHYAMTGIKADAEWSSIHPEGGGYVFLGDAHIPFGVSMWHQLHCLNYIRAVLNVGDDGSSSTEHCFHYLRQAILCAADTTLEPGRSEKEGFTTLGANVTHTCRDWKQVYDWSEEQQEK